MSLLGYTSAKDGIESCYIHPFLQGGSVHTPTIFHLGTDLAAGSSFIRGSDTPLVLNIAGRRYVIRKDLPLPALTAGLTTQTAQVDASSVTSANFDLLRPGIIVDTGSGRFYHNTLKLKQISSPFPTGYVDDMALSFGTSLTLRASLVDGGFLSHIRVGQFIEPNYKPISPDTGIKNSDVLTRNVLQHVFIAADNPEQPVVKSSVTFSTTRDEVYLGAIVCGTTAPLRYMPEPFAVDYSNKTLPRWSVVGSSGSQYAVTQDGGPVSAYGKEFELRPGEKVSISDRTLTNRTFYLVLNEYGSLLDLVPESTSSTKWTQSYFDYRRKGWFIPDGRKVLADFYHTDNGNLTRAYFPYQRYHSVDRIQDTFKFYVSGSGGAIGAHNFPTGVEITVSRTNTGRFTLTFPTGLFTELPLWLLNVMNGVGYTDQHALNTLTYETRNTSSAYANLGTVVQVSFRTRQALQNNLDNTLMKGDQ